MSYSTTAVRAERPVRLRRVRSRLAEYGVLVLFLAIAYAVAAFGSITTVGAVDGWYATAPVVPWTPPNWVFGPVWTVLYATIAVAGWLVWRRGDRTDVRPALVLFVVQLVLNSLWTPVFFGLFGVIGVAALWIAFVIILALDLAVAATIAAFWPVSRAAALLLVPYLVWILYATTLNWGDAVLAGQ